MSSNNLKIADLDFDKIKSNFKDFLRAQDTFKDYNFDGSSLSVLLDVLAYNTYYNAFYANMIGNEMFLDTATLRESIVSKAKMLGYTPSSRKSSEVFVDLIVFIPRQAGYTPPSKITVSKYSTFKSSTDSTSYSFLTADNVEMSYDSSNSSLTFWAYTASLVKLIEGKFLQYGYTVTDDSVWQTGNPMFDHYIIPSSIVDLDSLEVIVFDSNQDTEGTVYTKAGDLQSLTKDSAVYWLHEVEDNQYEIKFGDGVNIGKSVQPGNVIGLHYIATNGVDANNCKTFNADNISFVWSLDVNNVSVTSVTATPSFYRVLNLSQSYTSTFIIGETVFGKNSAASGKIVEWDATNKILRLISVAGNFLLDETVVGTTSGATGTVSMSSYESSKSTGGKERETDTSIKNLAPRAYQTQNRCVTVEDYETIIKRDYQNARSIKVWGGETMEQPQYGKVFICVRPFIGSYLTNYDKSYILNNVIGSKNIVTVQAEVVDPDYIWIVPICTSKYDPALLSKSVSLPTVINSTISYFTSTYLNEFNAPFYFSKFVDTIDASDPSITSTNVTIKLKKAFDPILGVASSGILDFSCKIKTDVIGDYTDITDTVSSTQFTFAGIENCEFSVSSSDITILQVVKVTDGKKVVVKGGESIGVVDYDKGTITFNNFITTDTVEINQMFCELKGMIFVYIEPVDYDLFPRDNKILDISPSDIVINDPININTLRQRSTF